MIIKKIVVGKLFTNSYLLVDEKTNEAAIVDPGFSSDRIEKIIEASKCDLKYILLTHGHFDHAFEANILKEKYNAKLVIYKKTKIVLNEDFHNLALEYLGKKIELEVNDEDIILKDKDTFNIGESEIQILLIGGHTIDSCAFYIKDSNAILTGDTLFRETIGRSDLYGGDENQIKENINNKIMTLPDNTKVYPGHGEETTIGHERNFNLYL